MLHEEAGAARQRPRRDVHEHTYVVSDQPAREWEILWTNIPDPTSHHVAIEREAPSPTSAEQTAELAHARHLKTLRERRARLANVASLERAAPREDPRPFTVRDIPGFG